MTDSVTSMNALKAALEQLEHDFRTIPDHEKDFDALQNRLEVLLAQTGTLSQAAREPLLPVLHAFQTYLQEHLQNLQAQAQSMITADTRPLSQAQAVNAYAAASKGRATVHTSVTSKTG